MKVSKKKKKSLKWALKQADGNWDTHGEMTQNITFQNKITNFSLDGLKSSVCTEGEIQTSIIPRLHPSKTLFVGLWFSMVRSQPG